MADIDDGPLTADASEEVGSAFDGALRRRQANALQAAAIAGYKSIEAFARQRKMAAAFAASDRVDPPKLPVQPAASDA